VDDSVKAAVRASAADYFESNIFSRRPASIRAVGFKIFYHHPAWDPSGNVWRYLQGIENLHVIHLKRENLLRSLVSKKIAQKTDVWKQSGQQGEAPDKRISLSPEECREYFETTAQHEREGDEKFSGKPVLQMTYELLTSQFDAQMNRIQAFLHVEPMQLPIKTTKQNPESLAELIVNYDEVRQALSGTRWEFYLA
jgi:LPS sulfotransferase NodH